MKIQISGRLWRVVSVPQHELDAQWGGPGAAAMCDKTNRILYFTPADTTFEVVMHELMHAYLRECHIDSMPSLGRIDFEELVADLVGENAEDMVRQAKQILARLRRGERAKRGVKK